MKGLIHGIGINDADYTVQINEVIERGFNGKAKYKMVWICPYYKIWRAMVCRAYSPNRTNMEHYGGVSVCQEWWLFSNYKAWLLENNYKEGLAIDKDLLILGNREYSPQTCTIVPASVNSLITCFKSNKGIYPVGVSKNGNRLISRVHIGNGSESMSLGNFVCEFEAHKAWQKKKADVIEERVTWWEENFPDNFNLQAASNLKEIAGVLRQEAELGIETTRFRLSLDS
jgi:hypothetical protein